MHDVVIVGAGPAGSYAGYLLAGQGLDVVIIDKEDFPRDKVCGGGVSSKTIQLLDFDVSPVVQRRITGAYLTYGNRETVIKDVGNGPGLTTLRRDFDHLLLKRAIDRGARFRPSTAFVGARQRNGAVELDTSKGSLGARYLLGADGVFSRVRKHCFPKGLVTYVPSVAALVRVDPRVMGRFRDRVLFDFGGMPRGYGWIFPKEDHLNVGVFSIFPSANIRRELEEFMSRYSSLRSFRDIEYLGFCIPLRNTRAQFESGNVWLLGDAAGFAESFYGEGIYYALKGATLAARTLIETFDLDASGSYSQRVKREIGPDLRYSELNARLFFSFAHFGFTRMVRSPRVNQYFAELISGHLGHRECFYKTLTSTPIWLLGGRVPAEVGLEI